MKSALLVILLASPLPSMVRAQERSIYEKDVRYAAVEIEKICGDLIKEKKIDWRAAARALVTESKETKTDQEHLVLLVRMLARLRDGHATVRPLEKGKDVTWPKEEPKTGPGMFWCRAEGKIFIKNSWSAAKAAGIAPGMEVVKVNRKPVDDWLDGRIATLSDTISFSTDHQAFFYACHWGLQDPRGTKMALELRTPRGRRERIELTYRKASAVPSGPAFFPEGTDGTSKGDVHWAKTENGWGYIHLRRCKSSLPELVDQALAEVGDAPGIILDFRGNSGGGFDHPALMGRFVPKGETLRFKKRYESAGDAPYGGPVVAIVDATIRSAGETAAAIFKEDGRAYVIGESPTAGMSSTKKTIELPSGLFALYVSVGSNMSRSNGGRGLEGVGVEPHEIIEFDPKDLAEGVDTLIITAEERLKDFPKNKVPYDPRKFGFDG